MEWTKQVLMMIDVQKAFLDSSWGEWNNPKAIKRMEELVTYWRENKGFVIHIQHTRESESSLFHPSRREHEFMDEVRPIDGETVIKKSVNSAFIGTPLEEILCERDTENIVIAGLTTPHCVSTTARMSGNLGFETTIVSDATAAVAIEPYDAKTIHDVTIATLKDEFAAVRTTKQVKKLFK